jgi:formylglycine-generating enzyme required for sulfatase activity
VSFVARSSTAVRPRPTVRAARALAAGLAALLLATCAARQASERARADVGWGLMVRLPEGFFLLGESTGPLRDTPTWERVGPFLLDVTEVTVAAYSECVKAGKCTPAATTVEWEVITASQRAAWSAYCNGDRADRADHPVNCVDWRQAVAYCAWVGKRLPSEAEWEWAARNGREETRYPWGNDPPAGQLCWDGEGNDVGLGRRAGTCRAGSHPAGASRLGIQDLAGGVWEWTSSQTVAGADSRRRGGTPVKVARGGGWEETQPWNVAATVRPADLPSRRDAQLGFRCASDP